ncbi:MAG: hypothetical protein EBU75_07485, partial [Betaproteobacteria bacterium]|nr:hypothetical protein [Betaproteobacteria bacterium]
MKPTLIIAWCAAALYFLVGALTGNHVSPNRAHLGLQYEIGRQSGLAVVQEIAAGGPAQRAGLLVGDVLDGESTQALIVAATQPPRALPITLEREGLKHSVVLTPDTEPKETVDHVFELYGLILAPLCLLSAALLAIARTASPSYRWLAVMLCAWSLGWIAVTTDVYWYSVSMGLSVAANVVAPLAMTRFWLDFCNEQQIALGKHWARWYRALQLLGLAFILSASLDIALLLAMGNPELHRALVSLHDRDLSGLLWIASGVLIFGTCVALPLLVMHRSRGAALNLAFWTALVLLGFFLAPLGFFIGKVFRQTFDEWWTYATMPLAILSLCGFIVLSLKRRMMSFEFALNLTAVYLVTGAVLVAAFWVLKKNIESVGYTESGSQEVMLSAALAGLAFVAKQLKGVAEQALKRLIFVNFNRRVAHLAHFSSQMGHHKTQKALDEGALAALTDFCQGARLELLVWDGRDYVSQTSGTRLQVDDEIPLLLRARRASLGPESLPARLAMPIRLAVPAFHRLDLVFFLLLYDAPDLPVLRPDEIRQIEDVVQKWETERALL